MKKIKALSWNTAGDVESLLQMIDVGNVLYPQQAKSIHKRFSEADTQKVAAHFAKRIAESIEDRYALDVFLVNALVFLEQHKNRDTAALIFLSPLLEQNLSTVQYAKLIEVFLTGDISEEDENLPLFRTSVFLMTELGLAIYRSFKDGQPNKDEQKLAEFLSTFFLSIANVNDLSIRLSLFYFFSQQSLILNKANQLSKIMHRFGLSLLDICFSQLYDKDTEIDVYPFLLSNIFATFYSDDAGQRIMREVFKTYMLKDPAKFIMFLKVMRNKYSKDERAGIHDTNFFKQMMSLYLIASQVDHRDLGIELLQTMVEIKNVLNREIILNNVWASGALRESFAQALQQHFMMGGFQIRSTIKALRSRQEVKRGRKPGFASTCPLGALDQIAAIASAHARSFTVAESRSVEKPKPSIRFIESLDAEEGTRDESSSKKDKKSSLSA